MSDKLMDTAPGGESSQYESIQTVTNPRDKQGGQMGEPQTTTTTDQRSSEKKADRAARTSENIRYGQTMSQGGMGGQTTTSGGVANTEGGFGGTKEMGSDEGSTAKQERKAAGYGGAEDMDRNVGA